MKLFPIVSALLAGTLLVPAAMAAECDKTGLSQTYASMLKADQALRGRYIHILELEHQKKPFSQQEKDKLEQVISDTDQKNEQTLNRLIKDCGWPGKLDHKRAARAAFFIIQHAPLDYQLKYLPLLEAANLQGEISGQQLAMLIDRILVRQGKPQKYGTEFEYGSNRLFSVEDGKHLNQRRKTMGLEALAGFEK